MSNYIREYICPKCFLLYDWPFPDEAGGRKPCLHCGAEPYGADDYAASYWEHGLMHEHGENYFKDKYWYVPSLITLARVERWGEKDRRRVERLPDQPTRDSVNAIKEDL